ncbi:MAG: hypothetical protein WC766_06405 [Patescibacteria group bacterium]|jgi:hypothetical protein
MKRTKKEETRKLKDALVRARTHASRVGDEKCVVTCTQLLEKVLNDFNALRAS